MLQNQDLIQCGFQKGCYVFVVKKQRNVFFFQKLVDTQLINAYYGLIVARKSGKNGRQERFLDNLTILKGE